MRRTAQWLFVNCILALALWSAQSAWSDDGISPFGKANSATFGFNTTASFGKASAIKSLIYFSAPQQGGKFSLLESRSSKMQPSESLAGRFMVHEGSLGSDRLKLSFTYQDITSEFSGFQALRDSKVAPAEILSQLEKEKGLRRTNIGLSFGSSRGAEIGNIGFGQIQDNGGTLSTRSLNFNFGKASLSYTSRSTDKGFTRLNDLPTDDKNAIALSILRQFDPNATEKQITDKDRKRIAQEAGLDRSNLRLSFAPGKNSTLAVQTSSVGDDNGSVSRQQISFTGKNAKFYFMRQDIDKDFRAITSLADIEKKAFGNEVGMRRMNFGGSFNAGSLLTEFTSSKVEDGGAAISRRSLAFTGKSFKLKANFADIDQNFSRISDLADPDRSILEQFRGYKKTDLTGSFNFAKNLSLDAFYMTAHNATEQRDRNQLRTNLAYTTPSGLKIVWFRDNYTDRLATGSVGGYRHQNFAIERKFGAFAFASVDQDVCEKTELDGAPVTAIVRKYHFGTDKKRNVSFVYDYKGQDFGTGRFENLTDYAVGYKASAKLSLKSSLHQIDRGEEPSEAVRTHLLQWEIKKGLKFSAEKTDRATNNNNDGGVTKLSLVGPVTDKLGPLTNVKVAAQYYSEEKNGVPQKGSESVKVEANVLKGNLVAEYAGAMSSPGNSFAGCGFSFVSDRDEKKRYHYNVGFRSREIAPGKPILARCLGLDAKLSRNTFLLYSLKSYDDQDGKQSPVGIEELKLTSALSKKINFICGFKKRQDYTLRTGTYLMDAGLSGNLPSGAAFELGFGINSSSDVKGFRSGRTCRIKYDHKVSADNYLSLEAQVTKWSGTLLPGQPRTDCLARLDFKRVFSL